MRVDEQKSDMRRLGWTSRLRTAKSISVKSRGRRSGNGAWKAAGITPGDLHLLSSEHDWGSSNAPRAQAEVSRGRSSRAGDEGLNELER